MTNTPNFNFTIAEGTDTVNLLTQLYPNFTSLDTILQAIKESGTTTAVTTKVGTVHNIVRNVADCNVIRWIATANYAAGDTFTVDGNAVTATAMDGASLPAGAFVINQSVLAILNSGVLTIVGVPGVSSVAASAVTYDNTGSGLSATDVQDAIDEVVGDIPTIPATYAATAITYDNSGSGLTAANAQDAIDELAAGIVDYTDAGLTAVSARGTILAGGYKVLSNKTVLVDITVELLANVSNNYGVITGFPVPAISGDVSQALVGYKMTNSGSAADLVATAAMSTGAIARYIGAYKTV